MSKTTSNLLKKTIHFPNFLDIITMFSLSKPKCMIEVEQIIGCVEENYILCSDDGIQMFDQ